MNGDTDDRNPGTIALSDVTVIVPTLNESANIRCFLSALPPEIALIVVDSSDDETPDLIEADRPERTRVLRTKANIPVARQLGAATASTTWLLFTDADVCFASGYFEALSSEPVGAAVGGLVGCKGTVDGFPLYHRWFVRGQAILMAFGIPAATGSNMLVRADALDWVGGFDSELSVNEDTELMFRIARAGYGVDFRPDLTVRGFDHRRLEVGLLRKIAHGALRNTALYLGVFDRRVRSSDWGYWSGCDAARVGRTGT